MTDFLSYIPFTELLKYLNQIDMFMLTMTCKVYRNLFGRELSKFKEWIESRCNILVIDFNYATAYCNNDETYILYNEVSLEIKLQRDFLIYPNKKYNKEAPLKKFVAKKMKLVSNLNCLINEFFDFLDEKYNLRGQLHEGDLIWIKIDNTMGGNFYNFPVYCYCKSHNDVSYTLHNMCISKSAHNYIIPIKNAIARFPLHYWGNYIYKIHSNIFELPKSKIEVEYPLFGHKVKYYILSNPLRESKDPMYVSGKKRFSIMISHFTDISNDFYSYDKIFFFIINKQQHR